MPRHYGLKAEPLVIHTTPRTLRQLLWAAVVQTSKRLLFKAKVKLGWRYR